VIRRWLKLRLARGRAPQEDRAVALETYPAGWGPVGDAEEDES